MAITMESITGAPAPAPAAEPSIPDEILQIPAFSAILRGTPPAVYVPKGLRTPEVEAVERNIEPLMASGFGVYRPLDGKSSVLFNTQFVTEEELKVADQKGKLDVLAPPLTEALDFFNQNVPADGAAAPAPIAPVTAPAMPGPSMAPAAQSSIQSARTENTLPGSPSSGPVPGQGRILNAVLKPVI